MKLGTHVHYTKTSKFSYSAKPDYAWGGCGGHFPKWPLSQKLRDAEPSTLTVNIGFVRRRFQKKYCETYHTTLSDIVKAILQNGGHFQSNTSISETKRRRAFNVDSMYRFCGSGVSRGVFWLPGNPPPPAMIFLKLEGLHPYMHRPSPAT